MPGKKVITDSMDSKEIIALLHEDFAFGQHKYDETYSHFLKVAKGYSHRYAIDGVESRVLPLF